VGVTAEIVRDAFQVGERCSVEILVRSDEDLGPGDLIEVQFPNSWYLISGPSFTREVQATDPLGDHYVEVAAPESGTRFEVEIHERNLFFPEGRARHGRLIVGRLAKGTVPAGAPVRVLYANTMAPYVAETDTVWVRVKGREVDFLPTLTVTPGPADDDEPAKPAETLRLIVPSGVEPGQAFDVLVVSLDRFENCSSTRYENQTVTTGSGEVVADGLNFTGSVRVPVTLNEAGIHRFRMGETVSNAVRVGTGVHGPYWGDIHVHTGVSSDGMGCDPYGYARQVSGLDFAGTADHTEGQGEAGFRRTLEWAREAHEPGRFVTILGDERNPGHYTGHHNVYFRDEASFMRCRIRPGLYPGRSREEGEESVASLDPASAMLVPHHTGIAWRTVPKPGSIGCAVDIDAVDDRGMRPVMEIYSHHGQSEVYDPQHILAYEFNRMRNPERRANVSMPGPFYAQAYWMAGRRLGVIGSSDEHSGQAGRRHGGLAAVFAGELTREAVFDAIRSRRCYATTGERILLEFTVDGVETGQSGTRRPGQVLSIRFSVWGTDLLLRVEVLRFRFGTDTAFAPILSEAPRPESTDAAFELEDEFVGPCMYYARVTQQPLEWPGMAWSSPIWIDAE